MNFSRFMWYEDMPSEDLSHAFQRWQRPGSVVGTVLAYEEKNFKKKETH